MESRAGGSSKRHATAAVDNDHEQTSAFDGITSRKRKRLADSESSPTDDADSDGGNSKHTNTTMMANGGLEIGNAAVEASRDTASHERTLISVEPIIEPKVDYISDQGIETIMPEPSPEERLAQVVRAIDFTQPIDAIRKAFNAQTKGLENTTAAAADEDAKASSASNNAPVVPPVDPRAALEPSFKYFHYALSEIEQLIVLVKALQGRNDLAQTVIPQHQLPAQQIQNDQIVALLAKKKHLRQASERLHTTATRLRQQVEQKREQAEVLLALRRKWMMIRKVGAANRPSRLAIDYGIVHDTVHRSKVVDLVKGEGDADDQTLKVAMPANQLNTGITVSCHRRAFDLEHTQSSRMHVKPLASPALAQGPQGIQRLIANAQFSLLCSIMYSELAREATLHHPSALVKVSEREIVFAPGTEYSLSIKASSAKPSSSSPEDEAASKPTRPLNIAFESSTTTTDSLVQLLCISLFRLFIAQGSNSNAAYLHLLPTGILQSASALDFTYSPTSDTIRTPVFPRVSLLHRLEDLWAHYHFRATISERLHQLRYLGKPVIALRWVHTGNPRISCAKIRSNMVGLPLQITLHGNEAAIGVSRQRLLSAKEVGDFMLHRMCLAIIQELKAEAGALGFKPVVTFLAVSIPEFINGSTLKITAAPLGDTSVQVELVEEGGSMLGAESLSTRSTSTSGSGSNTNRRALNWAEIPGSCYRTKLLFLLSHTAKHSSIPLHWYFV